MHTAQIRTTLKSKNHMQNGDAMKKKIKNACTMHDRRTIRTALAAFKGDQKPELSYPVPKKYKFKGAT
jgi:hypothetical protein